MILSCSSGESEPETATPSFGIASTLALGRLASVDDVVAASAAALREDPAGIRALLLDDDPRTDRELVALAGRLADLERRVARAADPADPTDPTRRMDP
ncbi:hypothetical protein [Clavibacter michiganensis]|uniref:hypothetical protein n=1 Tax=Clavibacter michiganensis TaxID=28447 RepID=UPI002930A1DB|nr:hypothetical protein [Clavibacter michiganensis]